MDKKTKFGLVGLLLANSLFLSMNEEKPVVSEWPSTFGYDYNKDGKLDSVETYTLVEFAPTVINNYTEPQEVNSFTSLQEKYDIIRLQSHKK
jgi:hypothetical protein